MFEIDAGSHEVVDVLPSVGGLQGVEGDEDGDLHAGYHV